MKTKDKLKDIVLPGKLADETGLLLTEFMGVLADNLSALEDEYMIEQYKALFDRTKKAYDKLLKAQK